MFPDGSERPIAFASRTLNQTEKYMTMFILFRDLLIRTSDPEFVHDDLYVTFIKTLLKRQHVLPYIS